MDALKRLGSDISDSLFGEKGNSSETRPRRDAFLRSVRVRKLWRGLVGDDLAEQLRPGKIEGDTLFLSTSDSAWLMEARFLERKILSRLRDAAPDLDIGRIKVFLDARARPAEPKPRVVEKPLSPSKESAIQKVVEAIEDPKLRERLAKIFRMASQRQVEPSDSEDGRSPNG